MHEMKFYAVYDDECVTRIKGSISVQWKLINRAKGEWEATQHLLEINMRFYSSGVWSEARSDLRGLLNEYLAECFSWARNRPRQYRYLHVLTKLSFGTLRRFREKSLEKQ